MRRRPPRRRRDRPPRSRRARDAARRGLRRAGALAERGAREFFADGCPQRAAAISYYAMLSLFPLAILTVAAFGLVVDDEVARARVIGFLLDQLPLRQGQGRLELQRTLQQVTAQAGGFGTAGLIGLVLTSSAVMGAIRQALNAAWDTHDKRPFLQAKAIDVVFVLAFGALTGISTVLALTVQVGSALVDDLAGSASAVAAVAAVLLRLGRLVPVVLMAAVFTALYRFAPATRTRLRDVWPGVVVATAGFELARTGFGLYLATVADYGTVYASLATVVAFLAFVFVAASVMLFGAEVASEWPRVRKGASDEGERAARSARRRVLEWAKGLVVRADGGS
jgi:membrane protein